MWHNPFTHGWAILLLATFACGARVTDYSIAPSTQLGYYHYPAPRRNVAPPPAPPSYYQQLPQQSAPLQQQIHQVASRSNQYATQVPQQPTSARAINYAQYQQYQQSQPQQQQQQYQYYHQQPVQQQQPQQQHQVHYQQPYQQQQHTAPNYQQAQYHTQPQQPRYQHPAVGTSPPQPVIQQFMSPALDNIAYTAALTQQGYIFGSPAATSTSGANNANLRNAHSVRLPLSLNAPLINVGPLPLMMGTPFIALQPDVTSYGTKDPQR